MKLTDLAIEGYGVLQNFRLGRLNQGLNIVTGDTGSGKSTLRRFVRGVLFGFEDTYTAASTRDIDLAVGQIEIRHQNQEYRLRRDVRVSDDLSFDLVHSNGSSFPNPGELTSNISPLLFDTVINVGFHDTRQNMSALSSAVHSSFGVPLGASSQVQHEAYLRWQQDEVTNRSRLSDLQQTLNRFAREKTELQDQVSRSSALHDQQLSGIQRELEDIALRLKGVSNDTQVGYLENEIQRLRSLIVEAESKVTHVPVVESVPVSTETTCATLYQRLDEIDNQIRRWRRVQADIQTQRVRLRDEMLIWNELTLESAQHPYHKARSILVNLEEKVDRAEHQTKRWNDGDTSAQDQSLISTQLTAICAQMREDIYGLCHELGHQYKHIRHKAAAAELKNLRRCYNEMGENTQRLLNRRESVIEEIREIDPAGAAEIVRADQQFCECAMHEGYLQARQKYVGDRGAMQAIAPAQTTRYEIVRPNVDSERRQLVELESQLNMARTNMHQSEVERQSLLARQSELRSQHDRLLGAANNHDVLNRIAQLDAEMVTLTSEVNRLTDWLSTAPAAVPATHPIIKSASELLSRMSMGEIVQVWLTDQHDRIEARDRYGKTIPFRNLSRGQQDQVYLSLCLAVHQAMMRSGTEVPLILDDVFANVDQQRSIVMLETLRDHCSLGNQIIALAKHNELPGNVSQFSAVFELPQTSVSPAPFSLPQRKSTPAVEPQWMEPETQQSLSGYREAVYPLTKYSSATPEPRIRLTPDAFETQRPAGTSYHPYQGKAPTRITESTQLRDASWIADHYFPALTSAGVNTLGDLLSFDPEVNFNIQGITGQQFDRWQSQSWLMICVPELNANEAQILVACGITEPEQLDTTHSDQLLERIGRFLNTPEGRRYSTGQEFTPERVNIWYQSLDSTRSQWRRPSGYSRRSLRRSTSSFAAPERSTRSRVNLNVEREPVRQSNRGERIRVRTDRPARTSQIERGERGRRQRATSMERTEGRATTDRSRRSTRSRAQSAQIANSFAPQAKSSTRKRRSTKKRAKSSTDKLKFYLDLNDHIEAAPSIGPRMAERFEAIGVNTIREFLQQTAESMAGKLNYKRAGADEIRQWQKQSRLICRIPNLRGHDAQLLVACDITEPEDIAIMQPAKLFDIIGPFSNTKEGLKIIRSGKQPDLEEITDWISWANNGRSLQAA